MSLPRACARAIRSGSWMSAPRRSPCAPWPSISAPTTVSAVLMDLKTGKLLAKASSGNGQIRYGADVINRIIEQGKPGGRAKLQKAIVDETLNPILKALCRSAGVAKERILRMCVASNTTMNHLLLGVEADLGPHGAVYSQLLPLAGPQGRRSAAPCPRRCRRGFGPPTSAPMWAAISPPVRWPACCGDKDEFTLFIDLGTNGELVFGNRDFMMSLRPVPPVLPLRSGDISCR